MDQSTVTGSSVTFNVTASGDGIAYQWQQSTNSGATWNNISGATSASYRISFVTAGLNGEKIRVVVTGTANTVTSSAVTLTVGAAVAPAITVQPTPQSATAGSNATFTVTATGTTLIYQWQASTNGGTTWTNISGQTEATLTLNAVVTSDNGKQVRANVSNSLNTVTSSAVALTVNAASAAPAFTTQPAATSVVAPATATFSAVATGTPAPTYQWQLSTNSGATFTNISGATFASYTTFTTTADSGKIFRVLAANLVSTATSDMATLTVTAATVFPAITSQPLGTSVTAPATATFIVVATGTPAPTYQWQISVNGGTTFQNITGETFPRYTTPTTATADSGKMYRVVVGNTRGSINSNAAVLTVLAAPAPAPTPTPITTFPLNDTGVQIGAEDANSNNSSCAGAFIDEQDCANGRDHFPTGDLGTAFGSAGFSFSKIDESGKIIPSQSASWACVLDNVTGLLWDANVGVNLTNWGDNRDGDASRYVLAVNASPHCGVSNWRLPSPIELHSIVHYGIKWPDIFTPIPLIDDRAFPNTPAENFWTSQQEPNAPGGAWSVSFNIGTIYPFDPRNSRYPTRLVSAGQVQSVGRWLYDLNGSQVIDTVHNLVWQRCAVGQSWSGSTCVGSPRQMDWISALSLVSTDAIWRLPNIKELETLIDPNVHASSRLDPVVFPGAPGISIWSSTPVVTALEFDSFCVSLSSGQVVFGGDRTAFNGVWLVRSR